jgi:hypothetical protein
VSDPVLPDPWAPPSARSPHSPSLGTKLFAILVALAIVPGGLAYLFRYQFGLADGTYAFIATQPGTTDVPVTYQSCRPITYVVNHANAVQDGQRLVDEAVGKVSAATGLRFVALGSTDIGPDSGLKTGGNVLIAWTDPSVVPKLAGDTVGVGGSSTVRMRDTGTVFFYSGQVSLDAPDLNDMLEQRGPDNVRAVIMHELAHVVGLGHVNDRNELMSKTNYGKTDFGPGDLRGLKILGKGGCEKQF